MRGILGQVAHSGYSDTPAVCIGGINASNVQKVLSEATSFSGKKLDGVAVVSAIMGTLDPDGEARRLLDLIKPLLSVPRDSAKQKKRKPADPEEVLALVPEVVLAVHRTTPLSHNMTNLVRCAGLLLLVGKARI